MFTFNVDLGQLIISSLVGIVGWFSVRTLSRVETRLDRHDEQISEILEQLSFIIGSLRLKKHE